MWHAWNYLFITFYCRGINFIHLVQLKVKDVKNRKLSYGRTKTDEPLTVKITGELKSILDHYLDDKNPEDYLSRPIMMEAQDILKNISRNAEG